MIMRLLGLDSATGPWYLFWSGVGSDLGEFAILATLYRKLNCHQRHCYRIGLHPHAHSIFCRKHHPLIGGKS